MKGYSRINTIFGWVSFAVALVVYMLTLQPSASFWDCGEFIASAFRLQVGHQPGAPMFMMLAKVLSLVASDPAQVAFWVNSLSALASALTVMFLFWTITALASRSIKEEKWSAMQMVMVTSAGMTGALAYAFSDSFWFSAVEAEVYAVSSLFTAVVFWAALRWERAADHITGGKWLILISYVIGLSIGIHLLSLLVIPAIALLWYFRHTAHITGKGVCLALLSGTGILVFVQYGIIQYLVLFAFKTDLFFVNTLNLSFGSGALVFLFALVTMIFTGIFYSHRHGKPRLNLALICISFILLGYSSYAMILLRAQAKTTINISNPDNSYSLLRYLAREQYGQAPLLYGQYFDAGITGVKEGKTTYRKGAGKYEASGAVRNYEYSRNTIFPRIYSDDEQDVAFYRSWLGLGEGSRPTFANNLGFFGSYQIGFMYMRYFLWNFSGRQNDEQGHGELSNGNWITGIPLLDKLRLGPYAEASPMELQNEGYNRFYGLPLLLGICGLIFHFRRSSRHAWVTVLLMMSTGVAIVLYLNQDPLQVRERDYAYVGSFYAFAVWIGLGVLAVQEWLRRVAPAKVAAAVAVAGCFAIAPYRMVTQGWDDHDRSGNAVARDMAVNYLESCAPNAILFTNADNDTYPLWYAQEVEGVRPDVRIVNLQLLFDPDYVTALKKKINASEPLPISMREEQYKAGVRDVIYYMDYGISDSVELKDLFEVLVSDHDGDKATMQDGSLQNILPTKRLRLTIDKDQLLKTGTLTAAELPHAADRMEWTYNRNYVSRSELALLDILAHNDWKRPVYFTTGISGDSYMGLDRYLHLEGFAYRLLPLKREVNDDRDKSDVTRSGVFYSNLMNKMQFGAFKKTLYLDPESRRIARQTWDLVNTLGETLVAEGRSAEAKQVMKKAMETLPMRNYSIRDSVHKYRAAGILYQLREEETANALVGSAAKFLGDELHFLTSLKPEHQQIRSDEIRLAAAMLNAFREEAAEHKQAASVAVIDGIFPFRK